MHPAGQCSAMAVMLHSGVALPQAPISESGSSKVAQPRSSIQDGISQPFRPRDSACEAL